MCYQRRLPPTVSSLQAVIADDSKPPISKSSRMAIFTLLHLKASERRIRAKASCGMRCQIDSTVEVHSHTHPDTLDDFRMYLKQIVQVGRSDTEQSGLHRRAHAQLRKEKERRRETTSEHGNQILVPSFHAAVGAELEEPRKAKKKLHAQRHRTWRSLSPNIVPSPKSAPGPRTQCTVLNSGSIRCTCAKGT